jgi:hypothetical protein
VRQAGTKIITDAEGLDSRVTAGLTHYLNEVAQDVSQKQPAACSRLSC